MSGYCRAWKLRSQCTIGGKENAENCGLCPFKLPSRRVVEPQTFRPISNETAEAVAMSMQRAFEQGYLACKREAVEAVKKLAESHPDINVNIENGWVKLSDILASIEKLVAR